jgi:hypothetical protein
MRQAGRRNPGFERSRAIGVLLLLVPALGWSCGGSSTQNQEEPSAGSGASATSGATTGGKAGSTAGGKAGVAGSSAGTNAGGAGPSGGAEPIGEGGAGGGGAGGVGTGGIGAGGTPDPLAGFACNDFSCAIGEACINCQLERRSERFCVRHPIGDPTGYAADINVCDPPPNGVFDDCDGPEDCAADQYCVAREGPDGFMRCRDLPSTQHSCCFACGAPTDCTICRSAEDCPEGETCSPAAAANVMGCQ